MAGPITDPALLAALNQGQAPRPQPFPTALPPLHGPDTSSEDRTRQLMGVTTQLLPGQVAQSNANLAKTQLELRKMRMEQGLDPDTGKPMTGAQGKIGEDAIADLPAAKQAIVKGIVKGLVPVSSYAIGRNPELYSLVQRAFQYEPGTDLTTFQRRQVAAQKFLSNPNSPMLRVNQALQHLERTYETSHKLGNYNEGGLLNPFPMVGNYARTGAMALQHDKRLTGFQTDRDALATELAAAFAGSGQGGALADRDHWRNIFAAAQTPESFDSAISEAAKLLGGRVEASQAQFRQAVGVNADTFDLMSPGAKAAYEKFTSPDFGTPAKPQAEGVGGGATAASVPPGYQDEHKEFLVNHPPGHLTFEEYKAFREQQDKKYGTSSPTINDDVIKNFVNGYNKSGLSPDTKVPVVPGKATALEGAATSAPAVALASFGNAATAGIPELMAGHEAAQAMEEAHPIASAIGDMAGSIAPIGAAEAGFGRAAKLLGSELESTTRRQLAKDVGANMVYQGVRGANENGVEGAFEGAGEGALGAAGGNLITKGMRPLLSAATQDALKKLGGVDLTTLQRLGLGKAENALTGTPGVHGAAVKAIESYNRQDANRVLSNIAPDIPGVKRAVDKNIPAGHDMTDFVHTQLNDAYNTIKPKIVGNIDMPFGNAMTALKAQAKSREQKAMFKDVENALELFYNKKTGSYDGNGYQAASERLRALMQDFGNKAENEGSTAARDMVKVADQARQQMRALVGRNDPTVGRQLKGLEKGWALKMRIDDAANRAGSNGGVYSPDQKLLAIKKLDTSGNKGMNARGKALDQPQALAAQKVMGSTPPKKISIKETAYVLAPLGGLSAYSPTVAAPIIGAFAAGAYGPGIKRIVQKALTGQRPSSVDNALLKRALEDAIAQSSKGNPAFQ